MLFWSNFGALKEQFWSTFGAPKHEFRTSLSLFGSRFLKPKVFYWQFFISGKHKKKKKIQGASNQHLINTEQTNFSTS